MKIQVTAWWLSAALALIGTAITPAMADEWNKETRLKISEPLEVPGKVLQPGTYIFKLADDASSRNIVEIYSEDASGRQKFVTTVLAISAYTMKTPEKVTIGLEERPSGTPQAIHTWFYPGDNTGWEFVYPKFERLESASANPLPAERAPTPEVIPDLPEAPVEADVPPPPAELPLVEPLVSQPEEPPAPVSEKADDGQNSANRMLPETAGNSATELVASITLLCAGLITVLAGLRKPEA
jgi:hypothetical protein